MSQAALITVNDGKATPVAHALTPTQNKGGDGFTFTDNIKGIPVYDVKVWAKLKLGTVKEPSETKVGVIWPVTKTVDSVLVQDHVNTSRVEFSFAPNATPAERADLYALTINALNNALIREQTRDLIAMY